MYVMVTSNYPMNKYPEAVEVFKKGIESPLPEYVEHLHTFARADVEKGMKSYAIYKVADEKLSEGYIAIARRMEPCWSIEGYTYSVEIVTDAVAYVQQRG